MSTVAHHFQNLASLAISKYIDTGDRMIDTACIAIVGVLVAWFIANARTTWKRVYQYVHIRTCVNNVFDPCAVDPSEYDQIALRGYKFSLHTTDEWLRKYDDDNHMTKLYSDTVNSWIFKTYTNLSNGNTCNMYVDNKGVVRVNSDADNSNLDMPIYRYIANDKYEYIVYSKKTLYCNHLEHLSDFVQQFTKKTTTNISTQKRIYEVDASGGMVPRGTVNVRKIFDRIHFDSKPEVVRMLDKLEAGTLYPEKSCLNNKLGFLVYGPPGTGKTGFCTAVANYLGRDILLLSSLMSSPKEKVLEIIDKCRKTHVIVLDEFDLILARSSTDAETPDYTKQILGASSKEEVDRLKKLAMTAKKSMGDEEFILKLLDGFGDDTDRVIIATTNHPEKINKKYLRPGRFDMVLLFGYCSRPMFRDIADAYYPDIDALLAPEQTKTRIDAVLARNISPLVLINTLVRTVPDFDRGLDMLMDEPVQEYATFHANHNTMNLNPNPQVPNATEPTPIRIVGDEPLYKDRRG